MVKSSIRLLIGAGTFLGAALGVSAQTARDQNDIATIQSYIERWVAVGQDLARTRANWQFERDILEATKESLLGEIEQIKSQIADAKEEEQSADEASKKLAKEQVALIEAADRVTSVIAKLEERLIRLVPRLPPHLQRKLGADLEILNNKEKREDTGIATRLTTVTNILQEAEKANNEVITVNEERDVDGKTQSVRTAYLGLAIAYSTTEDESVGWIGTPSVNGWEFEERPEAAKAIARVVAIANNSADVEFVPVTAKISD